MIHQLVFASMHEHMNLSSGFGAPPVTVNTWHAVHKTLQGTGDTIIWTVTNEQQPRFEEMLKKHELDKFLVVAHRKADEGTTNRNYMDKPRRLKVFIMKGKGKWL